MRFKKIVSGIVSAAMSLGMFAGIGEIPAKSGLEASAAATEWKFDLGGGGTESGYTGVSASDGYNTSRGYGFAQTWNVTNASTSGRGAGSDCVVFNSDDTGNTFNVDLPKGLYEVKVTVGNAPRTSIKMEGMLQMMNLTRLNATETVKLPVTDGQLNIQAVTGIKNGERSISAIEIKQVNTTGEMPPTVWICGDSTVANYYNQDDSAQHGWGQFFQSKIAGSGYEVRNMATSGQYAKGFLDGGQFAPIEAYGKKGDYYIISIGINDKNYSNETEYAETVTYMTQKAKAKGMTVLLVKQQGRRGDLTRSPLLNGRWFGGQLDQVGAAENVKVLDLFTPWQDFGLSVGYDGMASYYAIQANGSADDLHQSKAGAVKLAEIMADLTGLAPQPAEMDTSVKYRFKNVNSGLYLEVKDGKAEAGANVQQWNGDSIGDWNTWHLRHKGYNYYEIWSELDGGQTFLLDVDYGKADNGTNIGIYTNTNSNAQWFRFFPNTDGSYTIVTRCSGDSSAMEVASASMSAGANVQEWERNSHNCQKWIAEVVKEDDPTTEPVTDEPVTETEEPSIPTETDEPVTHGNVIKKRPGDANCDDQVDMSDVVMIMQYFLNPAKYGVGKEDGITDKGIINADVVGNDGVNLQDAMFIQRCTLLLEELPPVEYEEEPVTEPSDPWAGYYFAVDQEWTDGWTQDTNAGYTKTDASMGKTSNTGYIDLANQLGSSITFTVNAPEAGRYMAYVRFANGSAADRKTAVYVNGDTQTYWMQSFAPTGAWTNWDALGLVLPLKAGENKIKFESAVSDGGPNFDYLTITLTDEPVAEVYDPNAHGQDIDTSKPALYLVGDSTCMYYDARKQSQQGGPIQGWGYNIPEFFSDGLSIYNHAMAGRSSKKFYDEGRFAAVADNLKQGDFVTIQFAINDAGKSYADRYAPLCGNVDNPSSGSYEWYITSFIKDTKAKGATPILMSCTLGLKAYSNGRFVGSYTDYADACKRLAAKYSIPYVDVNGAMVNYYNSIGYDNAAKLHFDTTHLNETGSPVIAQLIANELKKANINGLSEYVK